MKKSRQQNPKKSKKEKFIKITLVVVVILMVGGLAWYVFSLNSQISDLKKQNENQNLKLAENSKSVENPDEKIENKPSNSKNSAQNPPENSKPAPSPAPQTPPAAPNLDHRLPTRLISQRKWFYCAPTTISMMLALHGKNIDQDILAKEMGTYEPFGTSSPDAIRVLNRHLFGYETPSGNQAGYRLERVTNPAAQVEKFKQRIAQNTKDGYPMYFTLDISDLYPEKRGEHAVAGAGYKVSASGDVELVYFVDPLVKSGDGIKSMTPFQLLNSAKKNSEPYYAW